MVGLCGVAGEGSGWWVGEDCRVGAGSGWWVGEVCREGGGWVDAVM